jgi:ParB-like chromosome segregation protein Spo0J
MKPEQIKTAEPFIGLFPIDPDVLARIQEDIQEHGYDNSQPIILWKGTDIMVDGHTRLEAAKNMGLLEIPVHEREFADEDEALAYAIHNQRNRRNLKDKDIIRLVAALDTRRKAGRPKVEDEKLASNAANFQERKSAKKTAETIGTSRAKVERTRTVMADEKVAAEVKAGEKSIHQAYQEIQAKRKGLMQPEPAKGNEDDRQTILLKALAELRAWRHRYKDYPELSAILEVIDDYQPNLEPGQALPEAEEAPHASESLEPLASVAAIVEVERNPQVHDAGNELPGCCTVETTGEPHPAVVDSGEPGNDDQDSIQCKGCKHFSPSLGVKAGRGHCHYKMSWDGKSTQFSDDIHPCLFFERKIFFENAGETLEERQREFSELRLS